jgi:hypothetical protein
VTRMAHLAALKPGLRRSSIRCRSGRPLGSCVMVSPMVLLPRLTLRRSARYGAYCWPGMLQLAALRASRRESVIGESCANGSSVARSRPAGLELMVLPPTPGPARARRPGRGRRPAGPFLISLAQAQPFELRIGLRSLSRPADLRHGREGRDEAEHREAGRRGKVMKRAIFLSGLRWSMLAHLMKNWSALLIGPFGSAGSC